MLIAWVHPCQLCRCVNMVDYEGGSVIFKEGDPGTTPRTLDATFRL